MGTYNPIPLDDGVKELRLNVGRDESGTILTGRPHKVLVIRRSAALRDSCCPLGKSIV